jgi:hypothetical protein
VSISITVWRFSVSLCDPSVLNLLLTRGLFEVDIHCKRDARYDDDSCMFRWLCFSRSAGKAMVVLDKNLKP